MLRDPAGVGTVAEGAHTSQRKTGAVLEGLKVRSSSSLKIGIADGKQVYGGGYYVLVNQMNGAVLVAFVTFEERRGDKYNSGCTRASSERNSSASSF